MHQQQGYTLATVLILLVMLTLLSLTTSNNTLLEHRMAFNVHQHQTAQECAEAARLATSDLMDIYIYKRGWHENQEGNENTTNFGFETIQNIILVEDDTTKPENWSHYYENHGDDNTIHSSRVLEEDMLFYDGSDENSRKLLATVSIYRNTESLAAGYGGAINSGYGQAVMAAANHGVNVMYDIRSYS